MYGVLYLCYVLLTYYFSATESILNVIYTHRTHWTCFRYQGSISQQQEERGEVISQSKKGAEEEGMIEMKEGRGIDRPKHTPSLQFIESEMKESYPFQTRYLFPERSTDTVSRIQKELQELKEKGEQISNL